jgi:hypothetical protein
MSFKVTILGMDTIYTLDAEANRQLDSFAIINSLYYPQDYMGGKDNLIIESQFTLNHDLNRAEDTVIVQPYYEHKQEVEE